MRGSGGAQRHNGSERDRDARFHIERPGTVEPRSTAAERHPVERPDGPDGIEVSQKQHGAAGSWNSSEDVIASLLSAQQLHIRTGTTETSGDLDAAAIHGSFVGAGGFQADQRVDRLDHLLDVAFAEFEQSRHDDGRI